MRKVRVYVAGPITKGDQLKNIAEAIHVADHLLNLGFAPFCPHAMSCQWHMHHPKTHEQWIDYDLEWVGACDALFRMPGESKGADQEVAFARWKGIPVFWTIADMAGYFKMEAA